MDSKLRQEEQNRTPYLSPTSTQEDLPPPYEKLSRPASSILSDITSTTLPTENSPTPSRPFPASFNIYYSWEGKTFSRTGKFLLGEHLDQPSNCLIIRSSMKGIELNLYAGPDTDSSIIAMAHSERAWSTDTIFRLPQQLTAEDGSPLTTPLKVHTGFKNISYSFDFPVEGADSKPHVEKFEWRMSHGKEIRELDKWSWGWKLVRLGGGPSMPAPIPCSSSSSSSSKARDDRDHGMTSDGKEVVAVWAMNSHWSKSKLGRFQFLGRGARGELGEAWSVLAVATMLALWQGRGGQNYSARHGS